MMASTTNSNNSMKLTFPLFWDGEKLSQTPANGSQSPVSVFNSSSSSSNGSLSNSASGALTADPTLTLAPLSLSRSAPFHQLKLPKLSELLLHPQPGSFYTSGPSSLSVEHEQGDKSADSGAMAWKPLGMPKRPRRRFHEVERKFACTYPNCDKAYGALNHLNAHIVTRNHGIRRKAREFITADPNSFTPTHSGPANASAIKPALSFVPSTYSPPY